MPKILINEIDNTSPGTPNGYANYSVLIAGFQKEFTDDETITARAEIAAYNEALETIREREKEGKATYDIVLPALSDTAKMIKTRDELADQNGVYEFTSADTFKKTIGLVNPGDEYEAPEAKVYHYGNQMAVKLLELGYSIIYLPITQEAGVNILADADTWKIFRDKASYDFRFVSHGLLESSDTSALDQRIGELCEAITVLNSHVLNNSDSQKLAAEDRIELKETTEIDNELEAKLDPQGSVYAYNDLYAPIYTALSKGEFKADDKDDLIDIVPGLRDSDGNYYPSCLAAVNGVLTELKSKRALLGMCITAETFAAANTNIANLAKYEADENGQPVADCGRGDCTALIELNEKDYIGTARNPEVRIINAINKMDYITAANGKYCAMTVPSIVYRNGLKMPGAFHYLACFINSLQTGFAEWYAAAGYTRGVASSVIDHTTVALGEIAINALEPRNKASDESPNFACNVIANFRGSYYLWGNRTAYKLGSANGTNGDLVASHFLNIRQLSTTIKKQLYVACRRHTFDPNSDALWFNFVNAIRPTLEAMKADQGIRDYKILKVPTDKKATLKAKIRIIPIEAVEDFDIAVSLEDSFGETTAVVTE